MFSRSLTISQLMVFPDDALKDRTDEKGGEDAAQASGAVAQLVSCQRGTISAGIVEGMNNNVKVTTRKAYGFRSYKAERLALYHNLGGLPEPEVIQRFSG